MGGGVKFGEASYSGGVRAVLSVFYGERGREGTAL